MIVMGYSEAGMFLRAPGAAEVVGVVSVHGRREYGVETEAGVPRLDLVFDDVDVPVAGDTRAWAEVESRRRWNAANGLIEVAPTPADVRAVVDFADQMRGRGGVVLCHCGGGMSRAPAVAVILLAAWRGPGAEERCVRDVVAARPGATPHEGLVRMADEGMGRGGRLVEAVRDATNQPWPSL